MSKSRARKFAELIDSNGDVKSDRLDNTSDLYHNNVKKFTTTADGITSEPSNRLFRDAWSLSGTVITEDITEAKQIFKDKVREVRADLLKAEDTVFMKALEADDTAAKTASATKKNSLRDAPAASAISSATTITELKAAWDTSLLGASPYA